MDKNAHDNVVSLSKKAAANRRNAQLSTGPRTGEGKRQSRRNALKHIHGPDLAPDNGLQVASLLDLTASKLKTIQQRAEAKDYRDVAAALDAGIDLAEALGAATAVFGKMFNAMATLKALTYFGDGNLPSLPRMIQDRLRTSAEALKLEALPQVVPKPGIQRQDV